jgi:hypothetical protein
VKLDTKVEVPSLYCIFETAGIKEEANERFFLKPQVRSEG